MFTSKNEQTEQLKNEIQQLNQVKENSTPSNTSNVETTHRPGNVHVASKSRSQTEITKLITFIEQTLQTLQLIKIDNSNDKMYI